MKLQLQLPERETAFTMEGIQYELVNKDQYKTLRVTTHDNVVEIIDPENEDEENDYIVIVKNKQGEARFDLLGGRFSHVPEVVARVLIAAMAAVEAYMTFEQAVEDRMQMWMATRKVLVPERQPASTHRVIRYMEDPKSVRRGLFGYIKEAFFG